MPLDLISHSSELNLSESVKVLKRGCEISRWREPATDQSPLSLPQGLAGFCTTELIFAGAEVIEPPTQGRERLVQQPVDA